MRRVLISIGAFVIGVGAAAAASYAAAPPSWSSAGGIVTYISPHWDALAPHSGSCSMFVLGDGREFAIFPTNSPDGTLDYLTVLAARTKGAPIQFWVTDQVAPPSCNPGSNNQPLKLIYSPSY
jgi:hypothetical protein